MLETTFPEVSFISGRCPFFVLHHYLTFPNPLWSPVPILSARSTRGNCCITWVPDQHTFQFRHQLSNHSAFHFPQMWMQSWTYSMEGHKQKTKLYALILLQARKNAYSSHVSTFLFQKHENFLKKKTVWWNNYMMAFLHMCFMK